MRHSALFVVVYLVLMVPTYLLPYAGSNSVLVGAALAVHEDAPAHWPFFLHVGALVGLFFVTARRGFLIDRRWLMVFPFLAGVFDMVPGVNMIPLIPTCMHLAAIIVGVAVASKRQIHAVAKHEAVVDAAA